MNCAARHAELGVDSDVIVDNVQAGVNTPGSIPRLSRGRTKAVSTAISASERLISALRHPLTLSAERRF